MMQSVTSTAAAAEPGPELGVTIRRRRLALGMTLEALAAEGGVSVAMLSEVERGVKNPTVKLAWQIARALGCSLTELLDEPEDMPVRIVRAAERRRLVDPETGVERAGLSTELMRRGLEVAWYRIPGGQSTGGMPANRAGVLEHVAVVRGRLTLRLGQERHELGAGDNVTYGPQIEVEYRNEGRAPCEFLLLSDAGRARA